MIEALGVFAALFALDFFFAFYTKAVQRHAILAASLWASVVLVFGGSAQIGYVHNPWLLIPAAAGAFGGTFCAMKWSERHDRP